MNGPATAEEMLAFLEDVVISQTGHQMESMLLYRLCCVQHAHVSAVMLFNLFQVFDQWKATQEPPAPPKPTWDPSKPPTLDSHEHALRHWHGSKAAMSPSPLGHWLPGTGFDETYLAAVREIDRRFSA